MSDEVILNFHAYILLGSIQICALRGVQNEGSSHLFHHLPFLKISLNFLPTSLINMRPNPGYWTPIIIGLCVRSAIAPCGFCILLPLKVRNMNGLWRVTKNGVKFLLPGS